MSLGIAYPPDLVIEFLSTLRVSPGKTVEEVFAAQGEAMSARPWPAVGELRKRVAISARGVELDADLVLPEAGERPLMLYVHGGGWEAGSPGTHRRIAHEFAARGFVALVPRYRLGPEHRHPAQLDDLDAALESARASLEREGILADRPAVVAGDSAGAHLAAALAVRRRLEGRDGIGAAVLLTGIYDYHEALPAVGPHGHDASTQPLLDPAEFERLRRDPVVNPVLGAAELPPCFIGVGGADPFAAQGRRLYEALREAGVEAELEDAAGQPHLHHLLPGLPGTGARLDRAAAFAHRAIAEAGVAR